MSHHDWHDESVGSLADEAEKLFGAISQNLGGHLGAETPECEWCPLCRAVRAARSLSPEVTTHLTVAVTALAQAAAALFDVDDQDDLGRDEGRSGA